MCRMMCLQWQAGDESVKREGARDSRWRATTTAAGRRQLVRNWPATVRIRGRGTQTIGVQTLSSSTPTAAPCSFTLLGATAPLEYAAPNRSTASSSTTGR